MWGESCITSQIHIKAFYDRCQSKSNCHCSFFFGAMVMLVRGEPEHSQTSGGRTRCSCIIQLDSSEYLYCKYPSSFICTSTPRSYIFSK